MSSGGRGQPATGGSAVALLCALVTLALGAMSAMGLGGVRREGSDRQEGVRRGTTD